MLFTELQDFREAALFSMINDLEKILHGD